MRKGVAGKATQVSETKSLRAVGSKGLKTTFAGKQWRILSMWISVKQHLSTRESLIIPWLFKGLSLGLLCGELRSSIFRTKNRVKSTKEQSKEEKEEDDTWSRVFNDGYKGRYFEFKYKMILTLSPIYNDDLQGSSHQWRKYHNG